MTKYSILTAAAVIIPGVLSAMSPSIPKPFFDKNRKVIAGSISEKVWVKINGLKHGMIIKGKNKNNPVILFLHGGPGMPEYFLAEKYMTGLEDHFVVCYWEQRGSGLSYNKNQTI